MIEWRDDCIDFYLLNSMNFKSIASRSVQIDRITLADAIWCVLMACCMRYG